MSPDRASHRSDRFEALCLLSQEMALVEQERGIYRIVLEVVRRVLDFTNCAILLVDEDAGELVMIAEEGYPSETRGLRLPLADGKGITVWVAANGERLYVPDVTKDPRYFPGVPEAKSELAVPIRIRDRTLGVLNVESDQLDAFDEDEAMLLQALASQLAVALELHRSREALDRLSLTDPMTGVYNRRYLDRLIPTERERAERFDHPLGLLMFDLDDFKEINDRFGHQRGDAVLTAFARALVSTARKIDPVIRYGGDEFLVVLVETEDEGARLACERIRRDVTARLNADPAVDPSWNLTISAGMAVRRPGEDVDERLREADVAMYRDKGQRPEKPPLTKA